ncbi:6-hydroxymethylpterin diphosphokinase MptE-like protein [Aliarcobacter cryaerophilus]|uniref:6-hydroxymethylpterin diphosphokinase MptE-like protein n=1 Tax=Aliarcobacter cryaerophilus TaxID=28198 RepID=UPI0021B3817D|nr:6-hydroxymethylpterin diphosphokinase MptE-like protein [Aliarcobacter cryaerophilus]MCT7484583.1 DUF115 domain-containing protein [Aliarcobacter cryaerophilus]
MTEAQIQLQNALTTTFLANLAFLSEYDNELYQRVDELSRMIENGTYKEKYALEFLIENGEFDIYDIVNDKYLYNKNPKKINSDLVRKVDFNEKNSIFDIPSIFTIKTLLKNDREKRFEYNLRSETSSLTQNDAYEYTTILNDYLENRKKRLKKIKKFIFLGTLLGRHIPKIAQKIDANMYLVLERNLEIFRLSLFTVDYTLLANKGAIFSIMDSYLEEETKISKFLNISRLDNYILKFSSSGINIDNYIDSILSHISNLTPIAYDYNRRLYSHINRITKYIGKYKYLQFKSIKETCNILDNTPILYIAAGPSLDDNIEWIKENQNKFFIVTIGAAYKKLLTNNIKIDMISTLDESITFSDTQFSDENVSKICKDTIILASTITNEKILKKFSQENLFIFEVFISLYKNNFAFSGFSVGEITLNILLQLNIKDIYLIGLDLALNQETGDSHSKDANSRTSRLNLDEEQTRDIFDVKKSLIKIKGNLKDEVFTTPFFFASIKNTEMKILSNGKNTNIYNLSKHGAFFEGTISQEISKINIKNPINIDINNTLAHYLKDNSQKYLDDDSKELLNNELLFLEIDINMLLNEIKKIEFKNYDEFLEKILLIPKILFENQSQIIYQIVYEYFALYIPYLSNYFNNLKIKDENKKVNTIKEIFVKQVTNIINDYTFCIKRVL